ncbi:hypothetical protein [Rubellicoccus peritrichatus]|uniref:Uncharacterized protein n=1 Tax=Rubellicoccus peritrichatus TaxID=3080537 RepID=A0AAQ3QW89_9BACT|nr:hypothetical protein [Puniceicoccus sp. CR14]WOO41642.1 hypothetical protein RZN69_00980 [Puniceicoccus sp. CR14]
MIKRSLTALTLFLATIASSSAYDYTMTVTATRGPGLDANIWSTLVGTIDNAYRQVSLPNGATFNSDVNGDTLNWTWTGTGFTTQGAREFRDQMQQTFNQLNQTYQQAGIDITWSFNFDGQGSTPVESASFDYPSAADAGGNWCYGVGYEFFYVGSWPWIYSAVAEVWYFNAGTEDNLWCWVPGDGWAYTTDEVFPLVYVVARNEWVDSSL